MFINLCRMHFRYNCVESLIGLHCAKHNTMLRWIILRFLLVALATADCPSYKCICTEQEVR